MDCSNNESSILHPVFCPGNFTDPLYVKSVDCTYFLDSNVHLRPGIPGLTSGVFYSKKKYLPLAVKI